MSRKLFITEVEPQNGRTAVALGVMEFLVRNIDTVALFRPNVAIDRKEKMQGRIIKLISHYNRLDIPLNEMFAHAFEEAKALVASGHHDEKLEGVMDSYKESRSKHDFVLCLGTGFEGESSAI